MTSKRALQPQAARSRDEDGGVALLDSLLRAEAQMQMLVQEQDRLRQEEVRAAEAAKLGGTNQLIAELEIKVRSMEEAHRLSLDHVPGRATDADYAALQSLQIEIHRLEAEESEQCMQTTKLESFVSEAQVSVSDAERRARSGRAELEVLRKELVRTCANERISDQPALAEVVAESSAKELALELASELQAMQQRVDTAVRFQAQQAARAEVLRGEATAEAHQIHSELGGRQRGQTALEEASARVRALQAEKTQLQRRVCGQDVSPGIRKQRLVNQIDRQQQLPPQPQHFAAAMANNGMQSISNPPSEYEAGHILVRQGIATPGSTSTIWPPQTGFLQHRTGQVGAASDMRFVQGMVTSDCSPGF